MSTLMRMQIKRGKGSFEALPRGFVYENAIDKL